MMHSFVGRRGDYKMRVYNNYDNGNMYYAHNLSLGKLEYKKIVYNLDNNAQRQRLLDLLVQAGFLEEMEVYNGHYLDMNYQSKEESLITKLIDGKLHNLWFQEKPTVLNVRNLIESFHIKVSK